jgi:hypothetical protein
MKRILLVVAIAIGLFLAGRALVLGLASDETKIRRVVAHMADGFDRSQMTPILDGLTLDYEDETSGARRPDLREAVAYLFFEAVDESTKRFAYRVEVDVRRVAVDRETAECDLDARFLELRGGTESPAWDIAVNATFVHGSEGWRIRRTKYTTRSGGMIR